MSGPVSHNFTGQQLLAGPLANRMMEPAMREGGRLSPAFGWLVGTGPGAGMGLIMLISGVFVCLAGISSYLVRPICQAETLLPDHEQDAARRETAVAVN